ncbi:alpha/beta fold hydrolase [Actinomycetospora sp. TBRC 11914]|uniref:alpha/beta fold hydrolase n=1 Tax=Actinomycetospora sp. TBRC 11914 TaxID=2729387 RepID=UPI00145CB7BA|nr:alpha/beta fold hydrolase [Actinomycetospora sp. TBRC 11914]NMO89490.1 alpha/beta fold hydrolase [Actinomycetospora sp. TBRC 11914]
MSTLYLHAVGLDGHVWDDVTAALADHDALVPDLPGHGAEPALPGPVTLAALVDHLAALVDAHGDGPVDVVGLSLGSMLAQQLAVHRPDRVRSLVLACGGMATDPEVSRGRAATTREEGMAPTVPTTLRRWFSPEALATPDHPGVAYARRRLLTDDPRVVAECWDAMASHDLREALGGIHAPTTVVAASGDASVPPAAMRAVAERVPDARYVEIAGPHIVVLENAAAFARVLEEHRSRVGARVGSGRHGS